MGLTWAFIYYCLAITFIVGVMAWWRVRRVEKMEAKLFLDYRKARNAELRYEGALRHVEILLRPNQVYISADPKKAAPGKRSREFIREFILRTLKVDEIQKNKEATL